MVLFAGTRLGPYEILAPLGAGGMGEVYRARDTKLNRDVALKILPELFALDPDRLARFKREAQLLASLNHPNIAAIYGFEESASSAGSGQTAMPALVLELVDGLTLADRIAQGGLPLDEALTIASQIAEALEAAHEKGIIHRDLKPANVKVTKQGKVKVLDFGLAKALEPMVADGRDLSISPTMTSPAMTGVGIILGTAAYMSPEQARGKAVDKRADIWALGCVMFEMLAGAKPFDGETMTDIVAAIVKNEPDWRRLPNDTPAGIRSLIGRCLQKDPSQRLRDAGDARIEMHEAVAESKTTPRAVVPPRAGRRWASVVAWALVAALALAVVVTQVRGRRTVLETRPVTRLDLNLPPGVELYVGSAPNIAFSPDGTRIAFLGVRGGVRQVYVRSLDQLGATPLRGTERAQACFFSPDGRAIGFIATERNLKKVSLADGLVATVAQNVDYALGSAWGADDLITFTRGGVLWQVPASGGPPRQLTTLNRDKGESLQAWPVSAGKAILFASMTGGRRDTRIEAISPTDNQRRVVVESATFPMYAPRGHLIFFRDGSLLAAPFDVDRLAVTGPAVRVLESLAVDNLTGAPIVALSSSGSLAYAADNATTALLWVSRAGVEEPVTDTRRIYQYPRASSDGRRLVVETTGDLWIQDTARSTFTRLTSDATFGNSVPVWTPDGKRIAFRTLVGMRWIDADGSGHSEAIPETSVADLPTSFSPDNDTLTFVRQTAESSGDVYVLSLREPKARPVVATPGYDGGGQFSPDGHWMAYVSDESGQAEVYVRPFPGPERKWLVSTKGGSQPLWNRNGRELFYRSGNKMMSVDVSTSPNLTLSEPRVLFDRQYSFQNATIANYDVSADGKRFVMVREESGTRLTMIINWFEELKRLVPTNP